MRIGVMLRSIDENQGIGIYTRNLMPRLLKLDRQNEYVLIYRTDRHLGRFAEFRNVREVVLGLPLTALWDQIGVPWLARRYDLDLIFNTKFTVPLLTRRQTAMMLHGSGWFTHPEFYHWLDVAYIRLFMPRYCRKADHLISNSALTTNDFVAFLGIPPEKITTLHLAADDFFKPVTDRRRLDEVRAKYRLPERFILSVTKYFPGKNVPTLIEAYRRLPPEVRGRLVLVGRGVDRYLDDLRLRGTPLERDILTPGWVDQEDLPAIYSQAEVLAFPSLYEEFGIPVVEAMSCGCPVVGSKTGAIPEIADGAAHLVDPEDADQLAGALRRVLQDSDLRRAMIRRGLERARHFDWDEHARATLEVFRRLDLAHIKAG